MFFFSQWQSKARAVAEHLNASIKQQPRNLRSKAMESIPSQTTVVNFQEGKGTVD
jgi:hypothetical protein